MISLHLLASLRCLSSGGVDLPVGHFRQPLPLLSAQINQIMKGAVIEEILPQVANSSFQ